MKRTTIAVFVLILASASISSAQSILGRKSESGVHINLLATTHEVSFAGGPVNVTPEAAPMVGVRIPLHRVPLIGPLDLGLGVHIHGLVDIKNGDGKNWKTGLAIGLFGYRGLYGGIKLNFIQERIGYRNPFKNKEDVAFVFGLRLLNL